MIQAAIEKRFPAGPESGAFSLNVEFEAAAGITVLFGPSGSGKTLTLDTVAGFVTPDSGRIVLDGETLFDNVARTNLPPRRRRCGYVFQNYALFPHMTLRQNLEFPLPDLPKPERAHRVSRMLERFRLAEMAGRQPHEVSGGQQQRCSIARALIGEPRVLLLDEPARGLDAELRAELYEVLRQVRSEFRTPVLLVTHDLDECFELGEEMLVLRDGRIAQRGTPAEVLDAPASPAVARLIGRYRICEAEIVASGGDGVRPSLRVGSAVIPGPLNAGSRGERVKLYLRPERLRAWANSETGVRLKLEGVNRGPQIVRLDFEGGIAVDMTPAEFEPHRDNMEWDVEFPEGSIGVFREGP